MRRGLVVERQRRMCRPDYLKGYMAKAGDVVVGALKVQGIPDSFCFESMTELLKSLPQFYVIELPKSLSNVVTGSRQPNEDETNKIWNRRTTAGDSRGLWVFSKGKWILAQGTPPGMVSWWFAADGKAPDGYKKVTTDTSSLPTAVKMQLMTQYIKNDAGDTDIWFAVIRV